MSDSTNIRYYRVGWPDTKGEAFVTGSHAYGVPNEDSDVDLIVLAHPITIGVLSLLFPEGLQEPGYPGCSTFSIGRLNLILVDVDEYEIWRQGTAELIERMPVTREEAVAHFDALRGLLEKK